MRPPPPHSDDTTTHGLPRDRVRPSPRHRMLAWAAVVGLALTTVAACSDDDTSGGAFCSRLKEHMRVIKAPVRNAADIDTLVAAYEDLESGTPLAIADSWTALTDLVRTAATVVPDDPASVQTMADAAYATERSARSVATWVATTCGFAMPAMQGMEGPVAPPAKDPGKNTGKNTGKDKNTTP